MGVTSLENKIKAEWNLVRSTIALHPYLSLGGALIVAWIAGRLHLPL